MSLEMRNEGQMTEFSMDAVVDKLHDMDVAAYVEQTGGGTATIYAGETYLDRSNDWRYQILAGPGWFTGETTWTNPRANTDDFYIGPDDDGDSHPAVTKHLTGEAHKIELAISLKIMIDVTEFVWPDGSHQAIDREDPYWSFGAAFDREIEQRVVESRNADTWPFHVIKEF